MKDKIAELLSRRGFIRSSLGGLTGLLGAGLLGQHVAAQDEMTDSASSEHAHGGLGMMGEVNHMKNGFDPMHLLTDWDYGIVSQMDNGQTLREYSIVAVDKEIEVAPGISFQHGHIMGVFPVRRFAVQKVIVFASHLSMLAHIPIRYIFMGFTRLKWMVFPVQVTVKLLRAARLFTNLMQNHLVAISIIATPYP